MLGTPCCTYLSLELSKAHLMRLWVLMYYLLIEFQHPKCLYTSIVVLSMFFLVVPNTWSINHQMGSEDRGLWPWRPPWRSPWTTSSLPGAWTSQVRRYFFISGQRAFLLRLAERAASSGSQKGDVYSFAIILYEIHGRSWTLFILERNIHHRTIDLKRSFIRDEFFWWCWWFNSWICRRGPFGESEQTAEQILEKVARGQVDEDWYP